MNFAYQPLLAAVSQGSAAGFDADAGSIQFAGQTAGTTISRHVVADVGLAVASGQVAAPKCARMFKGGPGQMTVAAPDIITERFRSFALVAASGDVAAAAQPCRIAVARRLAPATGTISVQGKSVAAVWSLPPGVPPPTGTPPSASVGVAIGL